MKKRLEEELQEKLNDVRRSMNKSNVAFLFDWPYNAVQQFSDGYEPDSNLDISFQNHWDEDLWKQVATLDDEEQIAVRKYKWQNASSRRSIDRLLPGSVAADEPRA